MNKNSLNMYIRRLIPKLFKLMPLKENDNPNYDLYLKKLTMQIKGFEDINNYISNMPCLIDVISNLSGLKYCKDIKMHNSIVKECISICQSRLNERR